MKTAGKPMIRDTAGVRQHRSPWPSRQQAILLVMLWLFNAAAGLALYRLYKLMTVPPRLQVCSAKIVEPYVYNPLNNTIQNLKLNITLCWK